MVLNVELALFGFSRRNLHALDVEFERLVPLRIFLCKLTEGDTLVRTDKIASRMLRRCVGSFLRHPVVSSELSFRTHTRQSTLLLNGRGRFHSLCAGNRIIELTGRVRIFLNCTQFSP